MSPISEVQHRSALLTEENSIYWSSIMVGVLTAALVGLLFNLLGVAIGLSMFYPTMDALKSLSIGTIIWLLLSGVLSLYAGGWVTGRFANTNAKDKDILNGIMVGAIVAMVSLILAASAAGSIVSNSFSLIGNVFSMSKSIGSAGVSAVSEGLQQVQNASPELTNKVKSALPDLAPIVTKINQKAEDFLSNFKKPQEGETRGNTPEKIKEKMEGLIQAYLNDTSDAKETKSNLVNALVDATGKTPEEINAEIDEWHQLYIEAKEKAYEKTVEATRKAAKIVSQVTLINFFILISMVVAAVVGSLNGADNAYGRRES